MVSVREAAGIEPETEKALVAEAERNQWRQGMAALSGAFAEMGAAFIQLADVVTGAFRSVAEAYTSVEKRKADYAMYPGSEQGYPQHGRRRR